MKLYNTLTRKVEELQPLDGKTVRMYSCGPTVYDHAHIGNLSAYIFADTLRRAIKLAGHKVKHVMNYTDVDDKTIRRSREQFPGDEPRQALRKLTSKYIDIFLDDMEAIGNDVSPITFIRATDSIPQMQTLIAELHKKGFAYIADDGVYFSISAYQKSGKKYGQLLELTTANTSEERIQNDEYDKESAHDFALWKVQKDGEPAWDFALDGKDLKGRPGWHIECSAMSKAELGQPFDIHTGGIDLIFPHHENEIAQSTALEANPMMAHFFAHNDHILVDGKKMAKSAQNFFTLQDIVDRNYDPLAFRLKVLQSHYRNPINFTWDDLEAAQNRLKRFRVFAALAHQLPVERSGSTIPGLVTFAEQKLKPALLDDLDTPLALKLVEDFMDRVWNDLKDSRDASRRLLISFLRVVDEAFGLELESVPDISIDQKRLISEREAARTAKAWAKSDELRDELAGQGIGIRDTAHGTIWFRL